MYTHTASLKPLGVEHFYVAFSIDHELDLRVAAQKAFELPVNSINDDLSVAYELAAAILPHIGQTYPVPAEEDDNLSVVSIASSGTDSDASKLSEADQTTQVSDVTTDEDASDDDVSVASLAQGRLGSRLRDTLYPWSQVAIGLTWAELPQFAFQFWELKSLLGLKAPVALKVKILLGLKAPVQS